MGEAEHGMAILLVDDEVRLRRTLARSLAARGHRVDEAGTHREAVAAATNGAYDLLLLDVNLPDATGWDVLRDLAAAGCSLPTVVLSAVPPSASRVREFRPLGVLHKPFPMDALLRLVGLAGGGGGRCRHTGRGGRDAGLKPRAEPTRPPRGRSTGWESMDVLMIAIAVGFFAACVAYVAGCENL